MSPGERRALWGIVTLLLGWCFVMNGRLGFVEGRTTYFHGKATAEERHAEETTR